MCGGNTLKPAFCCNRVASYLLAFEMLLKRLSKKALASIVPLGEKIYEVPSATKEAKPMRCVETLMPAPAPMACGVYTASANP